MVRNAELTAYCNYFKKIKRHERTIWERKPNSNIVLPLLKAIKLAINLPTSTHCQIESSIHNVY